MKMKVSRDDKTVDLPIYSSADAAGLDLRALDDYEFPAGEKLIIKTGLHVEIPKGHVGIIKDRSGFAAKHGLHCLAGVIDADYRGEIGIVMVNLGSQLVFIEKNTRVAQLVIMPVVQPELEEVDSLDETERGSGGFGSTGSQ
jgi:dUTP pyrophosphatase